MHKLYGIICLTIEHNGGNDGVLVVLIGDVNLAAPVLLAPMSGVTDAPFRTQVLGFGAPAAVTEMVAGAELVKENSEFIRRASRHSGAAPHIVQLAGREPGWMRDAARIATDNGADIIDINMGCPARRVTGGQSGCALMREPELARSLIAATIEGAGEGAGAPVTVKMRLGWDDDSLNAPELAQMAVAEGAAMITVHGRTRAQFYNGEADWRRVRDVVDAVRVPVIVNGDILDASSASHALEQSGAAGVMVGRGALGRPWRVAEIADCLFATGYIAPNLAAKIDSAITQLFDSIGLYGDRLGVRVFRKHLAALLDALVEDEGVALPADFKRRLCTLETPAPIASALNSLHSKLESAA